MKVTSAYANKIIKKLQDDKEFCLQQEADLSSYVAAIGEKPVIPEFDFIENARKIISIDHDIMVIKHAINVSNSTNTIRVGDINMTIDTALITMAQLNRRKNDLDKLRQRQPKTRNKSYSTSNTIEYTYLNYDVKKVQEMYDEISREIVCIQMELDKYNQTVFFHINDKLFNIEE